MRTSSTAFLFAVIAAAVSVAACAANDIKWTEQVKLSDGRVIEIRRRVELTKSGFPVQEGGFTKYVEICYAPMKLHWKSSGGYVPDIFDIVDGKAYMHVPLAGCYECRLHGDPQPNALYFMWDKDKWRRIRHEDFPERSEWNLLMNFSSPPAHVEDDPRGLITLRNKQMREQSALLEQQRLGWKRINDMYGWRSACTKCGRSNPNSSFTDAQDIFITDGTQPCKQ